MFGNNIKAQGFKRINVKLVNQADPAATSVSPGIKYYMPEEPHLEGKTIVGIEAHAKSFIVGTQPGDISDDSNIEGMPPVFAGVLSRMFLTLYSQNGAIICESIPLSSLLQFSQTGTTKPLKRIKPYTGKIDFSKSYVSAPANGAPIPRGYIPLTFYFV